MPVDIPNVRTGTMTNQELSFVPGGKGRIQRDHGKLLPYHWSPRTEGGLLFPPTGFTIRQCADSRRKRIMRYTSAVKFVTQGRVTRSREIEGGLYIESPLPAARNP